MGLLEISGSDLGRRNMGRDRQHRHARAVAIEQAIDEMQVAGSATTGTHRDAAGEMRLCAGGKGRDLLVAHVNPFDLALATNRVREAVQAVAHDSIDALDARGGERLGELIGDGG